MGEVLGAVAAVITHVSVPGVRHVGGVVVFSAHADPDRYGLELPRIEDLTTISLRQVRHAEGELQGLARLLVARERQRIRARRSKRINAIAIKVHASAINRQAARIQHVDQVALFQMFQCWRSG